MADHGFQSSSSDEDADVRDINLNTLTEALDEVEAEDKAKELTGPLSGLAAAEEVVKLPFKNLNDLARYIKLERPENIVLLVGAGISTAAGIPDFRSDTGIYNSLAKFKLKDPQDVFSLDFFRKNPSPFYEVARRLFVNDTKPTLTHYFIRLLVDKGHVSRIYTQNIDLLEHAAGIDEDKIVNAHGCHRTNTCLSCKATYEQEFFENHLRFSSEVVARCRLCKKGVIKPDITFFGEGLPKRFESCCRKDLNKADMIIVMGTSLKVFPVAGIVSLVPNGAPRVLFNDEPVGGNLLNYKRANNKRDFFQKGKTDETCQQLAELLGWLPELEKLMADDHLRISQKVHHMPDEFKTNTADNKKSD